MIKCWGHFCSWKQQQNNEGRVLDVSLHPHSNIISVNVKLMSPKYPALPYVTFSESHLMSEYMPEDASENNSSQK